MPMFEDVMKATLLANRTVVLNFATQPCWLYNSSNCSYPANPDATDWTYPRGTALRDPTARNLTMYYKRLVEWMVHGSFVDESGVRHTGGPAYRNLTYWEVFNEAEHSYTPLRYVHDYDAVAAGLREVSQELRFVGLGGAPDNFVAPFLNASNHRPGAPRADYISVHAYASCSQRYDPTAYTRFFLRGEEIVARIRRIQATRNALAPDVKIAVNELGIIMPGDNDPKMDQ
eukprot:Sspe_Gene.104512::Locus_80926_Transcript_2_3_Confidence_0.500_Length_1106::g.104512::m.104512